MSDASAQFARYDEEFRSLMQQIENSLDREPPGQFTENLMQQCDDLIKQMALEARSTPPSVKSELLAKVRQCKQEFQQMQSRADKQSLMMGGSERSHSDRMLLQKNEDQLAAQNETLERARRTMEETEAVALEITEELGNNRETLLSAQGRVREVSSLTGRARRILSGMSQREMQQKATIYAVAVGLVLSFFILLWSMWRR